MNKLIQIASVLSVLAALTGCEEVAETEHEGEGGGTEDAGAGGGGGSGTTDGEQRPAHRGSVWVGPNGYSYELADIEYPEDANTCEKTTIGSCSLMRCKTDGVEPIVTFRSAGKLTLSGGAFPFETEGDLPNMSGNFVEALWTGATNVTVAMSGADVPAFETTLLTPDAFELVTPIAKDQVLERSSALSLSWQKLSGSFAEDLEDGQMVVSIVTLVEEPYNSIECSTPVSAGSFDVEADLLLELPAGPAFIRLENMNRQTVHAGDYPVDVRLYDRGFSSTTQGGAASERVVLQ